MQGAVAPGQGGESPVTSYERTRKIFLGNLREDEGCAGGNFGDKDTQNDEVISDVKVEEDLPRH